MSAFGKSLEAAARKLRPYIGAKYRHAYADLVSRGIDQRLTGEKIVCCDFLNQAIDAVGGRYYFSLVRDIIDAGYFPIFTAHRQTLSSFGISRMKSLLLNERLGVIQSLGELKEPFFLITDDENAKPKLAERIVLVNYEQRICQAENEVAFPVFVHPQLAMKGGLPRSYDVLSVRPARIFFGGNTEEGKYDKDVIRDTYGMLSRREMLEIVAQENSDIHRPSDATSWLASTEFHPYVLCETQHCKIPQERWLEALGKADFFLACPGVGMPLCHNLIEALAAGAVPILQYAAYLPVPLRDNINCLAFRDSASLQEITTKVLTMSQEEIHTLRGNVQNYYNEFLAPGRFAGALFSGSELQRTLLLNAYRVPLP